MVGAEATPSEISRNSQKFEKQFSLISSYFSELNTSVPASKSIEPKKSVPRVAANSGMLFL